MRAAKAVGPGFAPIFGFVFAGAAPPVPVSRTLRDFARLSVGLALV
jgi:hypothetical protein